MIELKKKKFLVTGAAGFIGANLILSLLRSLEDIYVIGIDNLNDYYNLSKQIFRKKQLLKFYFRFISQILL